MTKANTMKAGSGAGKRPGPPHNAPKPIAFRTLGELAQAIMAEPRRASIKGQEVVLSRAESLCRLMVESAIKGSVSDLKFLIRIMASNDELAGAAKEQWVLLLAGADAEL
jgi:hypothetical protein